MGKVQQPQADASRPTAPSPEELMVRLCRGDTAALAALYDRFAPRLFALGVRILGEPREAEDILHDVFIQAWRHCAEYDPARGNVESWLVLRMRSRSVDRIRSAGRTRVVSMEEVEVPEATDSPEELLRGWERTALRKCLAELPSEQRLVVVLSYFEGLSGSEIAARTGVPLGTIKSRLSSAIARLRAALAPGGAGP